MTTKRWLSLTLALIIGCTSLFAGLNYILDPFCLFRCNPNRLIPVYTNERTTKYLFGFNYIPSNFDGVLVGTSISGNWNTARIRGYKVYNTSLSGGNTAEASLILDHVFDRGKIRLAIFIIHPAMGNGHEPKSASMNPQEYWGSLGSIPLLQTYGAQLLSGLGLRRNECDAYGVYDVTDAIVARKKAEQQQSTLFTSIRVSQNAVAAKADEVDEIAVSQYSRLIDRARKMDSLIVAVIPPRLVLKGQTSTNDPYTVRMLGILHPHDIVVDMNTVLPASFLETNPNFWDGTHLTDAAANVVIETINRYLPDPKPEQRP
jgi:hypothetical protein